MTSQALIDQDLAAVEAEIAACDDLLGWYPGNKVPLCAKLYTLIAARNIAYYQGLDETARKQQDAAMQVASELETDSDVFWVARCRAWLFAECGRGKEAIEEWETRMDRDPISIDPMHYAACCCLFGGDAGRKQALEVLPDAYRADNAYSLLAKAYMLAVSKAPVDEVEVACKRLIESTDADLEMQCGAVEVWLAYGDIDRAQQEARSLRQSKTSKSDRHWELFLLYVVGEIEADEFIEEFRPPVFQAHAAYYVALKSMATGDLPRARKHFSDCCNTGRCFANWYWWSKVFLTQLGDSSESHDVFNASGVY